MQYKNPKIRKFLPRANQLLGMFVLIAVLMTACGQAPTPTPPPTTDPSIIQTQSAQTVVAQITSAAPEPTATAAAVPPPPGPTPDPNVPVAVLPFPQPGQPSATANYNTLIYGGPGKNYVVYGSFVGGNQAVVVGKSEDGLWWAVDVPVASNQVGWVEGAWVTVKGADNVPVLPTPPVPPTTALVKPEPGDPQATSIISTYVRTGPGESYPAYGIAEAGLTGLVLGKSTNGQWLVVRLDPQLVGAGYGWVSMKTVQAANIENIPVVDEGIPPEVEAPPPPPSGAPSVTALEYVNVRSGPGLEYGVLVAAAPGDSGEVTGKSADNQWWQVKISTEYSTNGLGWVSAYYVTAANTGDVPVVEAPPKPVLPIEPPTSSSCILIAQNPPDETRIPVNSVFQTSWTLQNSGSTQWVRPTFVIRYIGASHVPLHLGADRYKFATPVEPGGTYTLTVPMLAPAAQGEYTEYWGIFQDNSVPVCVFFMKAVVR